MSNMAQLLKIGSFDNRLRHPATKPKWGFLIGLFQRRHNIP